MATDEVSPDEIMFLVNALEGPILAFHYADDPLIVDLIARNLAKVSPDPDPEYCLIELTEERRAAVLRQLKGN